MRRSVRLIGLIVVLALFLSIWVGAVEGEDEDGPGYDVSKQNALTEYALQFLDDPEIQYSWGGKGGRPYTHPDGEVGENDGYWSLEQVKAHHSEWSPCVDWSCGGTDCSGFVTAVYQHCGLYKGWAVSAWWIWDMGYEVSREEAVPGDVVIYFTDPENSYHCGLYLGDDIMIHTSTSLGMTGTSHDGVDAPNTSSTPTYPHLSSVDCESYPPVFCRVVDDISEYGEMSNPEVVETALSGAIVYEENLVGMVETPALIESQIHVGMPEYDSLPITDKVNLDSIKVMKDAGKITLVDIVKASATVLGVIVILYAVFLFVGFIFDLVNTAFDFSLVGILTFGYLRVAGREERKGMGNRKGTGGRRYVSVAALLTIIIVLVTVGVLLVSGVVVSALYRIVIQ